MSKGRIAFSIISFPNWTETEFIRATATTSRGEWDEHFVGDLSITKLVALIRTNPSAWAALREAVMPDVRP